MRAVVQRVKNARVNSGDNITSQIEQGLLVFVGFAASDGLNEFEYIRDKITNLRIFEDENKKMNLSVQNIKGKILIVPNFTLYADARKGRRPNFSGSAPPEKALSQFNEFIACVSCSDVSVLHGNFRENMQVTLTNDGPVTILLDSDRKF